jgi:peptidoglycan hydrolase CwlO-like protein
LELSYTIRVTPPPKDIVLEGRKRRTKSLLTFLDEELDILRPKKATVDQELNNLEREVEELENEVDQLNKSVRSVREQEWRSKLEMEQGDKGLDQW